MQARQQPAVEPLLEVAQPPPLEQRHVAQRRLPVHRREMRRLPRNAVAEAAGAACNSTRSTKRNGARTRPALPKTATRPIACLLECRES